MRNKKRKEKTRLLIGRISLGVVCVLLVFSYFWSWYVKKQQKKIELNSRYTFSVTMNQNGKVIDPEERSTTSATSLVQDTENGGTQNFVNSLGIDKIADVWLDEFLNQFTQKYLQRSRSLTNIQKKASVVLDAETNTVLVSFSAALKDSSSEFFSSWDGVINDDRFQCEWVITYEIDDHFDNTATVYVSQILSSEAYGISQYNQSLNQNGSGNMEVATSTSNSLAKYEIKSDTLYVTYDGEKMITVPVDCANLPMATNSTSGSDSSGSGTTLSTTELKTGSYQISTSMTAFLYGGTTVSGKKIPLMLCYSNDKGANWTTCEIDTVYTADYYYINFLDESNGVIVCGYDRSETTASSESSRIYMTTDGGETWNQTGSGPTTNIMKGVIFIDENIGYFCYNYVDGMDSNLYVTRDGGKTFSKVVMEAQELDSTAANSTTETTAAATTSTTSSSENATTSDSDSTETKLEWKDVYKDALVPIMDDNGTLTIYLTQGSNGVYNSGKTAAKYQSADKGVTWKYVGQLEVTAN